MKLFELDLEYAMRFENEFIRLVSGSIGIENILEMFKNSFDVGHITFAIGRCQRLLSFKM